MKTKVILPTLMNTQTEAPRSRRMRFQQLMSRLIGRHYERREEDPTGVNVVKKYDKYEFTPKEALRYMMDEGREYMFDGMILHNLNMRNEMRKIGATSLVERLRHLVTPNDRLDREMQAFVNRWDGKSLGDIDIRVVPIKDKFTVDGIKFNGLDEIKASVEKYIRSSCIGQDTPREVTPKITPKCHITEIWEPYPKFDESDYCDNRYYANYLIRRHPIRPEDFEEVKRLGRYNCCGITEETPADLLPMVYYVGDGGFMLVAERHKH